MVEVTPQQQAVADFCRDYLARNDMIPTTRAIQAHFGWSSQSSAINALAALVKKGILEENEHGNGRLRFVVRRALEPPEALQTP